MPFKAPKVFSFLSLCEVKINFFGLNQSFVDIEVNLSDCFVLLTVDAGTLDRHLGVSINVTLFVFLWNVYPECLTYCANQSTGCERQPREMGRSHCLCYITNLVSQTLKFLSNPEYILLGFS